MGTRPTLLVASFNGHKSVEIALSDAEVEFNFDLFATRSAIVPGPRRTGAPIDCQLGKQVTAVVLAWVSRR